MLTLLRIRNIAVVEAADISFDKGFSVLSGETGAGKSMIIDAVRMILGERMSRDIIRTGEKKASVYAEFSFGSAPPASVEALVDQEGKLALYREISFDGRNLCRINGKTVQTTFLRTIGEKLVDIHGQHDSRNLLDPDRHIEYIDIFAGLEGQKQEYRERYAKLRSLAREIKALQMDEGEKLRRIEMLDYQIGEIENARLSEKEEEELTERKTLLSSSEKLASRISVALECLAGVEGSTGAAEAISNAIAALEAASRIHPRYGTLAASLEEASYVVEDILHTLEDEQDNLLYSPEELNSIEERLDQIYRLKRKYGATVSDILAFLHQIQEERNTIAFSDQRREDLTLSYRKQRQELLEFAGDLSKKRHQAAETISRAIEAELAYLNMPNTRFSVEFYIPEDAERHPFNANGIDNLEFFLSVNKGENLKPLSKTASGGELSRIMLALKNVLTDKDSIPVQIFDEIDTGISGRAAQKVADKLWTLARGRQVLSVTHLSQLAAMADSDYLIEKGERDGRTITSVRKLSEDERAYEIARINAGEHVTSLALDSAKQMLEACQASKEYFNQTHTLII